MSNVTKDLNGAHEFTHACNGSGTYDFAIYCKHCGLVAWHANNSRNEASQTKAATPCPRSPKIETLTP